ncbi:hypothetical protein QCD70_17200 [Agreia sp. PsM10]|uniref:hypothetical protein n=1 Tax=Agreia sp. PsM10 TaxID=3030533 RepID=UPI00263B8A22|nr:hypothetical protein [Agreia sp. PsM10]MDN4641986.1 hypothetical protein [Agreia sp. PsM10]
MIGFFDPKSGRGGGQVVLERLLELSLENSTTALVMPQPGQDSIAIPSGVQTYTVAGHLLRSVVPGEKVVLVSNATPCLPAVIRTGAALRRQGVSATTVAILHNYPVGLPKLVATRQLLRQVDFTIAVEPGLQTLRPDTVIPTWLSVPHSRRFAARAPEPITATGVVKSYARPDATKGMHLLPAIYRALSSLGYTCEVALGQPLDGQERYQAKLERALAPWLVDGRRNADWVDPGDVFVIPSVAGEAACLTAQEALSNGAFVVASRIGLMSYLSPTNQGIRTFAVGDTRGAVDAIVDAMALSPAEFDEECRAGAAGVSARESRWYDEVVASLVARL